MSAGAPASTLSRTAVPVLSGVHRYPTATGASYIGRALRAVGTFGPLDVMGTATVVGYGLTAALALALGLTPDAGAPRRLRPAAPLVPVAFAGTALTVRAPEVRPLLVAVKGKLAHAR
ncbi:hypothetical protein [Streptomyces inhibens]|uniref:hypothetical protein n=1 Tax=Streptomyces inhibens TaxID=2293571 RepID=UPI003CC9F8D5